jgi:hypothetical protein
MGGFAPQVGISNPNPGLLQQGPPAGQPPGGLAGGSGILPNIGGQSFGSLFGLGKNGPNNGSPSSGNPFQPGATNPFLTGELAPNTLDPFAGGAANPVISTDQNNNLIAGPKPNPATGIGSLGRRRFQGRGGRRGLLGGRR